MYRTGGQRRVRDKARGWRVAWVVGVISVGPPSGVDPVGKMRLRISNKQTKIVVWRRPKETFVWAMATCIKYLTSLFQTCFMSGIIPSQWLCSIIQPVPKHGEDPSDPLTSAIYKVYCDILNIRLTQWAEDNGKLCEEQNGFRKACNCIDHIFVLSTILENRLRKKGNFCLLCGRPKSLWSCWQGLTMVSSDLNGCFRYLFKCT